MSDENQLRSKIEDVLNTTLGFAKFSTFLLIYIGPATIFSVSTIIISSIIINESGRLLRSNQGLSRRQEYVLSTSKTAHIVIIVISSLFLLLTLLVFLCIPLFTIYYSSIFAMLSIILSIIMISIMFGNDLLTNMKWLLGVQVVNLLIWLIWIVMNGLSPPLLWILLFQKYILRDDRYQKNIFTMVKIFEEEPWEWEEFTKQEFYQEVARQFEAPGNG